MVQLSGGRAPVAFGFGSDKAENTGAIMTGLDILKRDMDRLREAIRLDWQELNKELLTTTERRKLKEPTAALIAELKLFLEQL